jgi:hypothetical protein
MKGRRGSRRRLPPHPHHENGLADSPEGRGLVTAFIVIVIAAVLVSLLPDSELKRELQTFTDPVTDVTGLHQSWQLFSPPQTGATTLRAEADLPDGRTVHWSTPTGDRGLSAYRFYRWRRWEGFTQNTERDALHRQAAAYVAREVTERHGPPTEVRLYRRRFVAPRWGSGEPLPRDPDWEETLLVRVTSALQNQQATQP